MCDTCLRHSMCDTSLIACQVLAQAALLRPVDAHVGSVKRRALSTPCPKLTYPLLDHFGSDISCARHAGYLASSETFAVVGRVLTLEVFCYQAAVKSLEERLRERERELAQHTASVFSYPSVLRMCYAMCDTDTADCSTHVLRDVQY